MSLDEVVHVDIRIEAAAIVAAGFGVPAIFGTTQALDPDRFASYTDPADMLEDGYVSTDAEYLAAVKLMGQEISPEQFVVARRLAAVAQVETITPSTVTNSATYAFSLNGRTVTYTADSATTATEICDGLRAALAALSPAEPVTGTGTTTLIITADQAGIPFVLVNADAKLTVVDTTASHGIEEDLAEVRAAGAAWYATLETSRSVNVVYRGADWTEGNSSTIPTIFLPQTSEANSADVAYDDDNTDILARLKAAGFTRTAPCFKLNDAHYFAEAYAGRFLPEDPGTEVWALKPLAGITPDDLTTTRKNNLMGANPGEGKNANIYFALTPAQSVCMRGTCASGAWLDEIRFRDFLKARISEGIVSLMIAVRKIPMTDVGIRMLASKVREVLEIAKAAGKLDSYELTIPSIDDVSAANRRARTLDPPISFTARYSGGILEASVGGKLTD